LLSPDQVKVKVIYHNKKEVMATFHQATLYRQDGYKPRQVENIDNVTAKLMLIIRILKGVWLVRAKN